MGSATAGKPEESRMPDPVSSHTAAEHRWAVSSLEGQPSRAAGQSRDHPPEPETIRSTTVLAPPSSFRAIWRDGAETPWVEGVGRSGCPGRVCNAVASVGGSRDDRCLRRNTRSAPRRVVVKLYRDGDGTAPLEWSRLGFAQRVALPVPEPIVADLESVWFGRPTVVMSRLPGRPDLTPKDVDSWVGALAQALAELHETPLDGAEGAVTRPPRFETWRAPAGEHDPLTAAAVGAVTARLPSRTSERSSLTATSTRATSSGTAAASVVSSTGAQHGSTPGGTTRVLPSLGVRTPRTGHRRSPRRRILGHRRRHL